MATVHQLLPASRGISCHAWNKDFTKLALCPNTEELMIYEGCGSTDTSSWKCTHILNEHDMLITGISWSHTTDKIVTCSHDRNAYVWNLRDGKWVPTLCILLIDRAALSVQWSPDGSKFAVGSGSKCVPVCYYDNSSGQDWYVCKTIRKHKSTVLAVAWHPNNQMVATASTDYKCRVISAVIKEVDTDVVEVPFAKPLGFGEVYTEFSCGGWINAVAWSPSGQVLAFAGHDSTINIVTFGAGGGADSQGVIQSLSYNSLPFNSVCFLSETAVVGAGHDMSPIVFSPALCSEGNRVWRKLKVLTDEKKAGAGAGDKGVSKMAAARAMFQAKTTKGEASGGGGAAQGGARGGQATYHDKAISDIQPRGAPKDGGFSTAAMDGRVAVWALDTLSMDMTALGLGC